MQDVSVDVSVMDEGFVIDAGLIGKLFDVEASDVPALMRSGEITCVCESGVDANEGTFRLNLFHGARHVRLRVDGTGNILRRSVIDFGTPTRRQ